jgi:hypothetical protein
MSEIVNLIKMTTYNIYAFVGWLMGIIGPLIKEPIFISTIAVIFICAFLHFLYKLYKDWNHGWLTDLIETKIAESTKKRPSQTNKILHLSLNKKELNRVKESIKLFILELLKKVHLYFKNDVPYDIKRAYLPSITLLIAFFFILGTIFFFSHNNVPYKNIYQISSWYNFLNRTANEHQSSNIILILCGLVSIVFILIIFIAESVRDSKDPDQKRLLLNVSYLWPLVTFTTLSLLNFLWFKINILSTLLPILVVAGIIFSSWRLINFLIDPEIREKNRKKFLKDRIERIILESVMERIGNNILLGKIGLNKEIKIVYKFSKRWINKSNENYRFIESKDEGWIRDINLAELANLVQKLKDSARQLGFSIYQEKSPSLEGDKEGGTVQQSNEQKVAIKEVYLLKRYGEQLLPDSIFNEDKRIILALPKEFNKDPSIIDDVYNLVPHIFRINKKEPPSNAFRRELQNTKDQLIAAIKSGSLGAINDLPQTYLNLAETFLETMHRFGGGFSAEQAKQERGNFFEGWNEISWIRDDIRDLIIAASETNNSNVISKIAFLPISIAIRAILAKDHFLFQEFVGYSSFLYHLAKDKQDNNIKTYMVDHSWRYLKELSDFYIAPKLTDRENENNVTDFKIYEDFAIYLFRIFQDLLKSAFDYDDISSFKNILDQISRLYKNFNPENEDPNVKYLEQVLTWTTSEDEKTSIRNKISILRAKEESAKEIKLAREQVYFGLSSKILQKYKQNLDSEILKNFFDATIKYVTNDIDQLTKLFDSSRDLRTEDRWGWSTWEMIADGEVHSIDVHGKLDNLYCVLALRILRDKDEQQTEKIKISPSRDLAYLSEERQGGNNLITILNSIESNPDQWNFVLDETARAKIPALKNILNNARQDQEQKEKEDIKVTEIDPDKLNEFKAEIKKSFDKSGYLRPVLKAFGAYKDLTSQDPGEKIDSWGYNQIDDKAAFIKNWYVSYLGWGENYGQGMANSEDQLIFEKMVSSADNKGITKKQDVIYEIEKVLNENIYDDPVILQTLNRLYEYEHVRKSETFISRYSNDCPKNNRLDNISGYMGILKLGNRQVPVVDIFVREEKLENKVLITDLNKFGILKQYSPIDNAVDSGYKDDIFLIKVIDLNKDNERRQKLINDKPTWLEKEVDKEGYLRQKVLINLYEKFEFKVKESKAAQCISVELSHDQEK